MGSLLLLPKATSQLLMLFSSAFKLPKGLNDHAPVVSLGGNGFPKLEMPFSKLFQVSISLNFERILKMTRLDEFQG
jgi:hypothetical protein